MTDTSSVALAMDFGAASTSPYIDEPHPAPERRRRNREDWGPRLRRREASVYLEEVHGLQEAPSTLAKKACLGGGPIFESFGRVPYYRTEMLDSYAEARLSGPRRSTSDPGEGTLIEPSVSAKRGETGTITGVTARSRPVSAQGRRPVETFRPRQSRPGREPAIGVTRKRSVQR
jgi:hypothetical protein